MENIHIKLTEFQAKKELMRAVPVLNQVAEYIKFAKGLGPLVT